MQIDADLILANIENTSNVSHVFTGGQKSVFKALHAKFGDVAIKVIANAKNNCRVCREIEIITKNHFSNVPLIFDYKMFNVDNHELLVIVEQYISGQTIRTLLQQKVKLCFPEAISILHQLLSIAVELESKHLVHRDIKPENIIIGADGALWLLDFGIARHLDMTSITATEDHFGPHTLGYSAPEQYRNIKSEVDSRADLFSIGVTFYELITGVNPYVSLARSPLDVIRCIEQVNIPKLGIDIVKTSEMSDFIYILMNKFPSRRPSTARQALDWFSEIRSKLVL